MFKLNQILSLILLGTLAACTTTYTGSSVGAYDDVYYSPSDVPERSQSTRTNNPANSTEEPSDYSTQEPQESEYEYYTEDRKEEAIAEQSYNENYNSDYNSDNYYDYEYSARLRRFHSPSMGFGYYDPFYTDAYFYNRNPYYAGTSIYYDPFFSPYNRFSIGFGIGFGWSSWNNPYWGYNPYWGNPYWGGSFGYNMGYHHGYYNGYYTGLAQGGYYDGGSSNRYYGPRGSNINSPYRTSGVRATQQQNQSGEIRNDPNNTGSVRPNVRPTNESTVKPTETRGGSTESNTQPTIRTNGEPSSKPAVRPETRSTESSPNTTVPKNATRVPKQSTNPGNDSYNRSNRYSRPDRGGSYNRPTTPTRMRTTPTRTAPTRTTSPSRGGSYNSTPTYNRGSSGGGGSRSSSPRR